MKRPRIAGCSRLAKYHETPISSRMRMAYELCLATAGKQVPSGPDWIQEVKHDGYRMLVIRETDRVRLLSRNGTDWTKRYPWIAEAALKNRQKHFVIDGEAVILGVDGVSDFNGLHYRTGAFPGGLPHGP
jgi:bifunctional non-homologous end joining protein LigD